MAQRLLIVASLLILAGCARMPEIDLSLGRHLPCSVGPIILEKADQLTDATARRIITLNRSGAILCDWKKPAK